jgi:hypothetical protein
MLGVWCARVMRVPIVLAVSSLVVSVPAGAQEAASLAPTPINLFNGKNLDGWVQRGDAATVWKVDGDTIVGAADARAKAHGFLCTEKEYGDFILDVDFKVDPRFRAGLQLRSMSYPEYYGGVIHGDQVVIAPSATTGGIMEEAGRHWLYDLKGRDDIVKAYRRDGWNHLTVVAVGDTIKTWLNGVEGANLRDAKTPLGFIALEVNRGAAGQTLEARFRNLRLLPLDHGAPPRRTYVEVQELSPSARKSWAEPVLTQPENKPNAGTATVFKHPPRPPQAPPAK